MPRPILVVSTGVRLRWFTLLAAVAAAACSVPSHEPQPGPSSPAAQSDRINPANVRRLRGSFPAGYEIAEVSGVASPAHFWGLKPGWTARPAECGQLADPADGSPQGLSGSGSGGIIYVVVAGASSPAPGADLLEACSRWTMASGRTSATVNRLSAPAIEDAATVGMATDSRTVVEGGTETDLHATTATAYLADHVAFVTVVTDPGSGPSGLPPDFASTFLARAVATLRG
ncbi:MAG: DUF5642 family protein [Candidatus Sericytochromatia bacterium]